MQQTLTARELPSAVKSLCGRGDYQGACRLVIGFIEKGYIDFGVADFCIKAALQSEDPRAMYAIAEPAVQKAPKDWRSWQLLYQAYHADARWSDALAALDKIGKLSDSISGEYYLARAEAFERLLKPERALKELAILDELDDPGTSSPGF